MSTLVAFLLGALSMLVTVMWFLAAGYAVVRVVKRERSKP